jgi:dihydroneopterin aldolase
MDKIFLEGLQFYGYHGAYPEERKLGQVFIVDLELYGNFEKPARTDSLEESVDYVKVFQTAKEIVEKEMFQLLEALCLRLCEALLSGFPHVQKVTVKVKKPHVSIPVSLQWAGVEMTRSRS